MKKILLILAITFSATLFGQQEKNYYIGDLTSINDNTSKKVESYISLFSHDLNRNSELDKRAKIRNTYFISVVQQTSKSGELFSSMLDSIPDGSIGHTKCFGRSKYFVPAEVEYPELFPNLYSLELKVNGEIMYQVAWSNVLNERQISNIELVQKAVNEIKEYYKIDKLSQRIIGEYKKSKSHNDIIKQRGDGEYGSSTMYIITEKKLANGKWEYEVMIRNLIIFTDPIN